MSKWSIIKNAWVSFHKGMCLEIRKTEEEELKNTPFLLWDVTGQKGEFISVFPNLISAKIAGRQYIKRKIAKKYPKFTSVELD